MAANITPQLVAATRDRAPSDLVVVVVELSAAHDETSAPDDARNRFRQAAEPVRAGIREAGGAVIGESWLNGTLDCQVPVGALRGLQERDDVALLDVARPLSME